MKISYDLYKIISTIAGESLINASSAISKFIKIKHSDFFQKRSGKNIKTDLSNKKKIWFYASSVGEVGVCEILVKELLKTEKNIDFYVSVMTETGFEIARSNLKNIAQIFLSPIDSLFAVKKALNKIKPDLICMVETEIWPNLIVEAGKNKIPVIVLNARISNSSIESYKRFKPLLSVVFKHIKEFNMASNLDMENLKSLSYPEENIFVTGNAKYDFQIDESEILNIQKKYRKILKINENQQVIVCGSTRDNEEIILLKAFKALKNKFHNLKIIIVPRHLERVNKIEEAAKSLSIEYSLKTSGINDNSDLIIADTMGELKSIYTIADIVFTGGSLVDLGGQNILEPASLGKPVVFGPYMDDFKEISEILINASGGFCVDSAKLEQTFENLLENKDLREQTGQNAKAAMEKNRGSAKKQINTIKKYI